MPSLRCDDFFIYCLKGFITGKSNSISKVLTLDNYFLYFIMVLRYLHTQRR